MARHTVTDDNGNKYFYSDSDGDSNPDTNQTLYQESHKIGVGSTEVGTYNPSTGEIELDK